MLPVSGPLDSEQYYIAKARSVLDKIRETQNYIQFLDANSKIELPVGLPQTIGGLSFLMGIDSIRLTPTHTEFDACLEFVVPQNGQVLTFMGQGIKFTKAGGIVRDARLELLTDNAIYFDNNKGQLLLKGTSGPGNGTFAGMDCHGYKEMSLEADIVFSTDLFVPENPDGSPGTGRLKTSF